MNLSRNVAVLVLAVVLGFSSVAGDELTGAAKGAAEELERKAIGERERLARIKADYQESLRLYYKHDYQGAWRKAYAILQVDSQHWQAWQIIGNCQKAKGDHDGAQASYKRSLEINPNNPVLRAWEEEEARKERIEKTKEVKQPGSNLYWLRCKIGRRWTGSSCEGIEKWMDWHEANNACPSGYRLPTRQELVSLLGGCDAKVRSGGGGYCNKCAESSRCSSMFGQDEGCYWLSSSYAAASSSAWRAAFDSGLLVYGVKDGVINFRCVRSGP